MNKDIIYFDNAASSFPKPKAVIDAVYRSLNSNTSNPGRSGHILSFEASEKIFKTRALISEFFDCEIEGVIFTKNATEALNLLFNGILKDGDHVIISDLEHNSVLRPLVNLKNRGVSFDVADSDDLENSVNTLIKDNTKLIFITAASNVTGQLLPFENISKIAKEKNVLFGVDASQAAGHIPIKMKNMGIDYLCTAGHKGLFGIQGTGLLLINSEPVSPLIFGGTGTDSLLEEQPTYLPEGLESGTLNTPGIISLKAGIEYIQRHKNIPDYEKFLVKYTINKLKELDFVKLYSTAESINVISFNINDEDSENVSTFLNENGICVRGGYHCSLLAHKKLKTTDKGTVRISFSSFNNSEEVDFFVKTLKKYKKIGIRS